MSRLDRVLASQAWLLGLKKPSRQSWMNLAEFMRTNRSSMSEADAQFISAVHRSDMVALAQGEKELISHLIERHISWIFDTKVCTASVEYQLRLADLTHYQMQ
jgi:hypothetical protein